MSHKIIQVDAFTDEPFKGNPAAVCIMENKADKNRTIKFKTRSGWLSAIKDEV